jgi:DNA polymerase-1
MRNSKNCNIGALFSFVKIIRKLINEYDIDGIVVFDEGSSLIKKEVADFYKIKRESMPCELAFIKKVVLEYLNLINIPILSCDGFEADDLIYNYVNLISKINEDKVYILSSDKDLHSLLLLNNVYIIDSSKNLLLDKNWLFQKYNINNITKDKLLLYYSLIGDQSDNIIGIKGIGEKTASVIIQEYDSLDDLYSDNFQRISITPRIKNLLKEGKDSAYQSLFLIIPLIMKDDFFINYILISWNKDNFIFGNSLLKEYECNSILYQEPNNNNIDIKKEDIVEVKQDYIYAKDTFMTKIVQSNEDYIILLEEINNAKFIALDTETLSGDPRKTTMVGFSICTNEESAWYVPLIINGLKVELYDLFLSIIESIDCNKTCIMHNALFDMHVMSVSNVIVPQNIFDTMIVAYIFKEPKIGLKELSLKFFNQKMNSFSQVMEFGAYQSFDQIEIEKAAKYAATDARQTFLLYLYFINLLKDEKYLSYNKLFLEIEMPLLRVLYKMEEAGIICDKDILIEEEKKYVVIINELHEKIKSIALEKDFLLNPMSNKQTSIFLYDVLKLPSKTKKTDQATLSSIEGLHEIIPLILLYRSLKSNVSHFTTGLLKYIELDQKIYTHYQQYITSTGRITTINPNLQNIPRNTDLYKIRTAFKAPLGYDLISFDYSQIELRVLAYFSKDPILIKLFNENQDIHALTASILFNKRNNEISNEERQIAKKINFSTIYGQGAYSLSKDLKITLNKAKEYLKLFQDTYPGIFIWMNEVVDLAKINGFVTTLYGLKRYIPELSDYNKNIFKFGQRIAINTIIQGTAAEIMKKAMIDVDNYFQKKNCGKIVLQIHDELLIELKEDNSEYYINQIKEIMELVIGDTIALEVNVKKGKHW